ncbi:MAG: CarD family transcriptional regulator [Atopobiaceae bacterium]|jgi:RNA polymerase-interacting CarD/CdnL/TRCF family regulator
MYEVGDYIVHPGQGVCEVQGIAEKPQPVYELSPVGMRHPMLITFPVASEDRLRPVLSHDEAVQIINDYPDMAIDTFTASSNALEEEHFKNGIRRGSCKDSVRIAKTFIVRIRQTKAHNKKPPVVYERILKEARQRSLEELSVALDMTPEDVQMLFEQREEPLASFEPEQDN